MRAATRCFMACILGLANALTQSSQAQNILGFSAASTARQNQIENQFKAIPTPEEARRQLRIFTAEPHLAGSERNNELARYMASEWKKQGLEDIVLRRYDVYTSEPKEIMLEMVAPVHYRATLREAAYDQDPDSRNLNISAAWIGMSASGDITAPVIYAHSGNPADFELLRKNGIDVRGKIVLVRYSNPYSYRGFKALTAEKAGAAAILIYSDPAEDGYKQGKVFPDGPWGPETHLQRGAIEYDYQQAGDPTTPGWASVPGAKHMPAGRTPRRFRKSWRCPSRGTTPSLFWNTWTAPPPLPSGRAACHSPITSAVAGCGSTSRFKWRRRSRRTMWWKAASGAANTRMNGCWSAIIAMPGYSGPPIQAAEPRR